MVGSQVVSQTTLANLLLICLLEKATFMSKQPICFQLQKFRVDFPCGCDNQVGQEVKTSRRILSQSHGKA
jgi:hypothetical protein